MANSIRPVAEEPLVTSNNQRFPRVFCLPARKDGVSLVELLVGCGVILIVVAIAIPVVLRSSHLKDQSVCANNLRQIGLAILNYTSDHAGVLPGPVTATQRATYTSHQIKTAPISLLHFVAPYLGLVPPPSKQVSAVFECPAQKRLRLGESDPVFYLHRSTDMGGGVSQRPFGYQASGQTTAPPMSLVNVVMPSRTVALFDTNGSAVRPEVHLSTRNVLFLDGHTERMDSNKLVFDATTVVIK